MNISKIVIITFAFFGIMIFGNVLHELSHYFDVKDNPNLTVNDMCFFSVIRNESFLNSPIGYVSVEYTGKEPKSSEFKAYFIESFFSVLLLVILYKFIFFDCQNTNQ
jgi:hypothetical protein